ncbi:MAG: ROK family protein [Ignavibacteriae bacterium]|nr:ROK family protein [Ignavibacteriota bacterium]
MYLGIDIGGTNLKSGVIGENGNIIEQSSIPTNAIDGPDTVIQNIKAIFLKNKEQFPGLRSVGIGVPGIVTGDGIIKISPNLPRWINLQLKTKLSGFIDIPLAIDNDANTAAVAELEMGAGKDLLNFFYITLGTGVGGTIIINREIFRGDSGGAGEIGHTIINANDKTNCYTTSFRSGVLEEFIGRKQIIELAKSILKIYPDSSLCNIKELDVSSISDAASENDMAAIECFNKIGFYLGAGIASAMNLLDISTAIIGGGISMSDDILFDCAFKTIKLRALPTIAQRAELRKAFFTKDAGIIGAGLLGKKII